MHGHMLHRVLTDICTRILRIAMQSGCRSPCWRHETRQWQHSSSPNRWLRERPEVGQTSNLKLGSAPASATSIIRSSCDTAAMWLGLFLRNGKVELESSRIWLASGWTRGWGGSTGGSGNGIKNFDLVIGKQKFCTDNTTKTFCRATWASASTIVSVVSNDTAHLDVRANRLVSAGRLVSTNKDY